MCSAIPEAERMKLERKRRLIKKQSFAYKRHIRKKKERAREHE